MEPRIALLCPTRGRPSNMARLVSSIQNTAKGDLEVVWYFDEDDKASIHKADELISKHIRFTSVVGERIVLSQMWNRCFEAAQSEVNIFMHCGDDLIFRSRGWDERVVETFEQFPDHIAFVHGEDGIQGAGIGTHGFIHRKWVETVGYFVPPYFSSDYNDTWLTDLANRVERHIFLPDVYTEHMHPGVGKGDWDRTHQERSERHVRDDVAAIYALKEAERIQDAEKLRAVINGFRRVA